MSRVNIKRYNAQTGSYELMQSIQMNTDELIALENFLSTGLHIEGFYLYEFFRADGSYTYKHTSYCNAIGMIREATMQSPKIK